MCNILISPFQARIKEEWEERVKQEVEEGRKKKAEEDEKAAKQVTSLASRITYPNNQSDWVLHLWLATHVAITLILEDG